MDIGIKGYESVKKALIRIEPGEVVGIKGGNNLGKSAIIRGFESFVLNEAGSDFINIEMRETRVVVRNDRATFSWDKNEKRAQYSRDKKPEIKIGRSSLNEAVS